jgi:hypothetical protein
MSADPPPGDGAPPLWIAVLSVALLWVIAAELFVWVSIGHESRRGPAMLQLPRP